MPEGVVTHVGWVVVGVGTVVVVGAGRVVVVGALLVGVVPPEIEGTVVEGLVVVVGLVGVVGEGEVVVVVGSTTWLTRLGLAVVANRPTSAAEERPEPTRTPREIRRTRASRRSRCCGVRGVGVMESLAQQSYGRLLISAPEQVRIGGGNGFNREFRATAW
jgi:hypothetical protein